MFTEEDCKVYGYKGDLVCILNKRLLEKQHITSMGLASLKHVHRERDHYVKGMAETPADNKEVLQWFTGKITEADRELQKLWGFPVDDNYHKWWEVPHCCCGALDAQDSYGTPYRYINGQCPVHGT